MNKKGSVYGLGWPFFFMKLRQAYIQIRAVFKMLVKQGVCPAKRIFNVILQNSIHPPLPLPAAARLASRSYLLDII
jgi:hypothetical protein